jgi:site-specific DNA-methyltransferase (adenine-specific)
MFAIPDASIDLILTDLPYQISDCAWDERMPFPDLWRHYNRIKKTTTPVVLFSNQPFTTLLINSNLKNFRYCWYWIKNNVTGFAFAKTQPMRRVEDICVFYDRAGRYYPQGVKSGGNRLRSRKVSGDCVYDEKTLSHEYTQKFTGFPDNCLYFDGDDLGGNKRYHPTQKPIAILEYLIKTYTEPGAQVLDSCMGSGSTGVACKNLGRDFIGIEKTKKYYEISVMRNKEADIIAKSNLFSLEEINNETKNPSGGGLVQPGGLF